MLTPTSYRIPVEALSSGSAATRLARAWLMLGVAALIGSGLLAVLLAVAVGTFVSSKLWAFAQPAA